jgi:DNA-binding NarL/FixJ family response regulator
MDYRLPDGSGVEGIRLVHEHYPKAKVVMLTGFADEAVLLEAVEAGCSGFITKDEPLDELVAAIRAAAGGEISIAPAMLARLLSRIRTDPAAHRSVLSEREVEVLRLVAEGLSTSAVAELLDVSPYTARNHFQNVMDKLDVHTRLQAITEAVRRGIVTLR